MYKVYYVELLPIVPLGGYSKNSKIERIFLEKWNSLQFLKIKLYYVVLSCTCTDCTTGRISPQEMKWSRCWEKPLSSVSWSSKISQKVVKNILIIITFLNIFFLTCSHCHCHLSQRLWRPPSASSSPLAPSPSSSLQSKTPEKTYLHPVKNY